MRWRGTASAAGGGWRALLADVLGDAGTVTARLLVALTDPTDHDGWGRAALDDEWRRAERLGPVS